MLFGPFIAFTCEFLLFSVSDVELSLDVCREESEMLQITSAVPLDLIRVVECVDGC